MRTAILLVALLVGACAHKPELAGTETRPQVNRAAKADKYAAPKAANVEQPTPNQIVKKRWYDRFKVHPKWFNSK